MKYLNKNWNPEWLVNINGNRLAETKSIGYKWVRYRTSKWDRYSRMKRAEWDNCVVRSLVEEQHQIDIFNKARELGVEMYQKVRSNAKPTPRTFADIKADVDYLETSLKGVAA